MISDTIHNDMLAAVRHANGRDWWVMAAKEFSDKYYIILLSPSGLEVKEQSIGEPTWSQSGGEIVFSPDGSKMARFNAKDDLRIFDFDRCTGTLSNPQYIEIHDDADNQIFAGLAFSADGHYLYAAEIKHLLQFDMQAADIGASMLTVAERELTPDCPLGDGMSYLELGPDGRIYGRHLNGQRCMHRMNHPERAGTACDMQQNYYMLDFAYKNLPHFPNFRLGPVDGSACDTLGLDNHPLAGWRYDDLSTLKVDFTSVSWYEPQHWLWDFGDNSAMSADTNPAHTFPAAGAYSVCLTVSNNYGADTKCKTVWVGVTGTQEPAAGTISVFPNPTTGEITWRGLAEGERAVVQVYDQYGRLCYTDDTGSRHFRLDAAPNGLYWLCIRTTAAAYRTSILLQH